MSCSSYNWWWERHFFRCQPSASTIPSNGIDTTRLSSLLWITLSAERLGSCDRTALFVTEDLPRVLWGVCAWILCGVATRPQIQWAVDLLCAIGYHGEALVSPITIRDLLEDWVCISEHMPRHDDDDTGVVTLPCTDDLICFTEDCIASIGVAGFTVY